LKAQRDAFISALFEKAKKDKSIILISVDMGAPSLDRWRQELPQQFFAAGISEQNAINFAAGLSATGKKVYIYYMAAWSARCFEQLRYSCAMANNPITVLGNGIALGYTPAGPAHCPTEDIAYMRSLCDIEIYSPCNSATAEALVEITCRHPIRFRYIRLERSYPQMLHMLDVNEDILSRGLTTIKHGSGTGPKICILSSGYMLGRALDVANRLTAEGKHVSVVDLFKIKPINTEALEAALSDKDTVVTIEEQNLFGGFGSAICETMADLNSQKRVLRIGLPERYIFENGTRDHLLDTNGLSVEDIYDKIQVLYEDNKDSN